MKHILKILFFSITLLAMLGCAAKKVAYDLPSVETIQQPEWTQEIISEQDSIYLVIKVPYEPNADMTWAIQEAQSELNLLLQMEIDSLLTEYLRTSNPPYPEAQIFKKLSRLPVALEKIMVLSEVKDAWEKDGEIAVLCGFDHAEVSAVLMKEMKINDQSFIRYFKWKMEEVGKERL